MYKKKSFFVVFEGIEGSGKSFQAKRVYKNLKKNNYQTILTREPGGTKNGERIRNLILKDYFSSGKKEKLDKYSDTLLYLAARNEHILNKVKPSLNNKKIVICDRFIDSTLAYQVYGKKVDSKFVKFIHKYVLNGVKPDLTFLLTVKINKAIKRLKKRKNLNRYDKFPKKFYIKAQRDFIRIAKKNKKKYIILDSSENNSNLEKIIFKSLIKRIK
tara:strand:+ start:2718 stop:3362 length:645 start_codon:yes stop_codon:yes gene_type:complete